MSFFKFWKYARWSFPIGVLTYFLLLPALYSWAVPFGALLPFVPAIIPLPIVTSGRHSHPNKYNTLWNYLYLPIVGAMISIAMMVFYYCAAPLAANTPTQADFIRDIFTTAYFIVGFIIAASLAITTDLYYKDMQV